MDATRLVANISYVECPNCKNYMEGFVNDPRGAGYDSDPICCEECGESIKIPTDIAITLV